MHSTDEVLGWRSRKARDRDGDKVGSIEEIYLDAESGNPQWAAVKTGLIGSKLTFVPLEGARPDGDDIVLDWPERVIKDAPSVDADGELSPEEEDRLYTHYERFDSPEYHGGGNDRDDDRGVPAAAEGAAVSSGIGRDDVQRDDDDTGARARSEDRTDEVRSEGVRSEDVRSEGETAAGQTRRPRIKRYVEEELGPDGSTVRRSTRTEEIFD